MVEKKKRATSAVGDDLSISIPSLFRCPISLDVMKSPVSLCTGVTYDRSSIQKWLDGGHDTCPATMQVLKSKDLVPNHTLHRIIQIWSDSASAQLNDSLLSGEQARELITEMSFVIAKPLFPTAGDFSALQLIKNHLFDELAFPLVKQTLIRYSSSQPNLISQPNSNRTLSFKTKSQKRRKYLDRAQVASGN